MDRETATRARIAALIYMMTNGVIFGAGLITVMTVPALTAKAAVWIPLVVVASFILAAPAAWVIAPWMRSRFGQQYRTQAPRHHRPERLARASKPGRNRAMLDDDPTRATISTTTLARY